MTFRHVVLFRVRDDVTDPEVAEAVDQLRQLGTAPGVIGWAVELSLDDRKGRVIVEDATFSDQEAFQRWNMTPAHERAAKKLARIADWLIADWIS